MTRPYGKASFGKRCFDFAADGRWERVTLLSGMRLKGKTYSLVFDGSLDGKVFHVYVEKVVAPALKSGDMLNVHKSKKAKQMIHEKGAFVAFLPSYSPDLNPVEKMWSRIKEILRGTKARTRR